MMQQQSMLPQQPNMRPQWNPQQQQPQQQQAQSTSTGMSSSLGSGPTSQFSSVLRDRLSQKVQQQQAAAQQQQQQQQGAAADNPTLKGLLNHPPQGAVAQQQQQPPQQQPPQQQPQQGLNPRLTTLQQQLSRPPNPASTSGVTPGNQATPNVSMMGGQQQMNPMMQQQQQMQAQQSQAGSSQGKGREQIWEGELEWKENTKPEPNQEKTLRTVKCSVSSGRSSADGSVEVKSDNWPRKLIMQLIPKTLVQTIGGSFFKQSR